MSYSIRNTLLLLTTLVLMLGIGIPYIYYTEQVPLNDNRELNEQQLQQIRTLEQEAARFQETLEMSEEMQQRIDDYPKSLFPSSRLPRLYDYFRRADRGSVFMNFNFADSSQTGSYGRVRFFVDGLTDYRQLRNFVYTLEESSPLVKINELQMRPTSNMENLHEVTFRMGVESVYSRNGRYTELADIDFVNVTRQYNPFFPLVHDIRANEENLPDVERSRLAAISGDTIFIYDQGNNLQRLRLRDRVYNGYLERISPEDREAVFFLNKGGIVERITLRLMQ
ncbi:MAG: hypothetical protein LAT84_03100 [Balneolia bacterium]|nr:hypothetical protein [Balneolia bacterium]